MAKTGRPWRQLGRQLRIATYEDVLKQTERLARSLDARILDVLVAGMSMDAPQSMRKSLVARLRDVGRVHILGRSLRLDVRLAEDYVGELLSKLDLLEVEQRIAESVDVILLCLESPGALTELGAFAANTALGCKLYVWNDKALKKARSFVNLGPVHHMQSRFGKDHVLWVDPSEQSSVVKPLKHVILCTGSQRKTIRKSNMFTAQRWSLLSLYVFDGALEGALKAHWGRSVPKEPHLFEMARDNLFHFRAIQREGERLFLTPNGVREADNLMGLLSSKERQVLDYLRTRVLTSKLVEGIDKAAFA